MSDQLPATKQDNLDFITNEDGDNNTVTFDGNVFDIFTQLYSCMEASKSGKFDIKQPGGEASEISPKAINVFVIATMFKRSKFDKYQDEDGTEKGKLDCASNFYKKGDFRGKAEGFAYGRCSACEYMKECREHGYYLLLDPVKMVTYLLKLSSATNYMVYKNIANELMLVQFRSKRVVPPWAVGFTFMAKEGVSQKDKSVKYGYVEVAKNPDMKLDASIVQAIREEVERFKGLMDVSNSADAARKQQAEEQRVDEQYANPPAEQQPSEEIPF